MEKISTKELREILTEYGYGDVWIYYIQRNYKPLGEKARVAILKSHNIPLEFWDDVKANTYKEKKTREEREAELIKRLQKYINIFCKKNKLDKKEVLELIN